MNDAAATQSAAETGPRRSSDLIYLLIPGAWLGKRSTTPRRTLIMGSIALLLVLAVVAVGMTMIGQFPWPSFLTAYNSRVLGSDAASLSSSADMVWALAFTLAISYPIGWSIARLEAAEGRRAGSWAVLVIMLMISSGLPLIGIAANLSAEAGRLKEAMSFYGDMAATINALNKNGERQITNEEVAFALKEAMIRSIGRVEEAGHSLDREGFEAAMAEQAARVD